VRHIGVALLTDQGTDPILGYLVAMLGAPEGARVACHTYHSMAMRYIEPAMANMVSDWIQANIPSTIPISFSFTL
jgi:hypothetical protein